jgi:hypothetical protein
VPLPKPFYTPRKAAEMLICATGSAKPSLPALPLWKPCVSNIYRPILMLTPDFKEFAELLNLNRVEYLVVGGYALAAYVHPLYWSSALPI